MKKMMTLAACLLLAAVTHAAVVGWTIAGANAFANGGYDLFVIGQNGVTSYEQITALLQSDGVEALSGYAWSSGTVAANGAASKPAASSGMSITYIEGGSEADNTYEAFAVIWDAGQENASYTATASITLGNNSTGKTFLFGNQSSNLAANMTPYGGAGGDIPEPTSGLLLLVGGAALALRRKQK